MVTGNDALFCLKDHTLSEEEQQRAHLSLQLDPDSFQWAVVDGENDLILEVGSLRYSDTSEISRFIDDWEYSAAPFKEVSLAHRGIPFTLVPSGLFQSDQAFRLLSLTHRVQPSTEVRHVAADALKATLLYVPLEDAEATVLKAFPAARVHANANLLIGAVMNRNRFDRPPQVYADLSDSFAEVFVAGHKDLLLANRYDIESDEDALYVLSNVFSTLGLDPAETTLYLSGAIDISGDRFKLFRSYYPKLQLHFGFEMAKVSMGLSSLRKQAHMSILNQYRCVS